MGRYEPSAARRIPEEQESEVIGGCSVRLREIIARVLVPCLFVGGVVQGNYCKTWFVLTTKLNKTMEYLSIS